MCLLTLLFYWKIKQHFISTPEQSRDYIFFATKEMQKGNWKGCLEYLNQMSIWKHVSYLATVSTKKKNKNKLLIECFGEFDKQMLIL